MSDKFQPKPEFQAYAGPILISASAPSSNVDIRITAYDGERWTLHVTNEVLSAMQKNFSVELVSPWFAGFLPK